MDSFFTCFYFKYFTYPNNRFKISRTTAPAQAAWPTGATTFNDAVDMTDGIRRNGNNYYISTAEGLNLLCDFDVAPDPVDKNWNPAWTFYLENDIDMSAYPNFIIAASGKYKFTGTFDGQGHSITMKSSVSGNAGLFRYAMNITIKNLTLKGSIEASNIACGFHCCAEWWHNS